MAYVIRNQDKAYLYETSKKSIKGTTQFRQAKFFTTMEEAEDFMQNIPDKYKNFYIECCAMPKKKTKKKTRRCSIPPMVRKYVYRRDNGKCALCGCDISYDDFTIDHIIPLAKGGENDIDNFQCTCRTCNSFKKDILPEDFMQRITTIFRHNLESTHKKGVKQHIIRCMFKMVG